MTMKKFYHDACETLNKCKSDRRNDDNTLLNNTIAISKTNLQETTTTTTTTTIIYNNNDDNHDVKKQFKYDSQRGRWSATVDFYFACTTYAFGTNIFLDPNVFSILYSGIYGLFAYFLAIIFYSIPIFLLQTFLGQFSSSGAISALRVVPILKGIGYMIVVLNLISLTYYGVIGALPLVYAVNALQNTIPWMSCNNTWNTVNCSTHNYYDSNDFEVPPHAVVEYFKYISRSTVIDNSFTLISWPVFYAILIIWLLALILLLQSISFIGKFFRCTCILMLTIFFAIFTHLIFYKEISLQTVAEFFNISWRNFEILYAGIRGSITMATSVLGVGYGNVLTLASFNSFRRDSEKLTYWVCFTHVILTIMAIFLGQIAYNHFEDEIGMLHYHVNEEHDFQFLYLCYAYLFGSFTSLPNFWSFLFFALIFLAEFCAIIIQFLSITTAICDEHERLRRYKSKLTIALVTILLLITFGFCMKHGLKHLNLLPCSTMLTHTIISLILLLVCLWIYGRKRFQCDLQYMIGKTISNAKILLLRFITPIFICFMIFQYSYFVEMANTYATIDVSILNKIFLYSTYMIVPIYIIYKIYKSKGSLKYRLKQCLLAEDWHPVDADNRRYYEEIMGISEMLVMDDDDVITA